MKPRIVHVGPNGPGVKLYFRVLPPGWVRFLMLFQRTRVRRWDTLNLDTLSQQTSRTYFKKVFKYVHVIKIRTTQPVM